MQTLTGKIGHSVNVFWRSCSSGTACDWKTFSTLEFHGRKDTVAFPITRICTKTKLTSAIMGDYQERTVSRLVQGINLMVSNIRDGNQIDAITNPGPSRRSTSSETGSPLQSTEYHTRIARKRYSLPESTQHQVKKRRKSPGEAILSPTMLAKCYFVWAISKNVFDFSTEGSERHNTNE
ncbi:unnamed protein product [Darwinula stevensoni]|uniref:Uncharacterized protein n=1 Tax=Darwinula stevensoni TaxID=69355 RepID=A0A7R9AE84_9CRUS|nr:unnamed protein product [Darwinula stevensoni]CAG0901756.1 unnamed protein product [Darwinula stevensoni]